MPLRRPPSFLTSHIVYESCTVVQDCASIGVSMTERAGTSPEQLRHRMPEWPSLTFSLSQVLSPWIHAELSVDGWPDEEAATPRLRG